LKNIILPSRINYFTTIYSTTELIYSTKLNSGFTNYMMWFDILMLSLYYYIMLCKFLSLYLVFYSLWLWGFSVNQTWPFCWVLVLLLLCLNVGFAFIQPFESLIASLLIKTKVAFWRAGFYPSNQNNLKSFQEALIGWKKKRPSKKATFLSANQGFLKTSQIVLIEWIKASPPKKPLLLWSCKHANSGLAQGQSRKSWKIKSIFGMTYLQRN